MIFGADNENTNNKANGSRKRRRREQQQQQHQQQERRQLDYVGRITETECSLTTSINTNDGGGTSTAATGVMFTMEVTEPIDLLTLEFQLSETATNVDGVINNVQVYYRQGDFTDAINQPSLWTILADTNAHLVENAAGAIVPVNQFESATFSPGQVYSIYVISTVAASQVDAAIGTISSEDESVSVRTGVSLEGNEAFPASYTQIANFNGVVHYRVNNKSCQQMTTTTEVGLEFAVDEEPLDTVISGLTSVVSAAVQEVIDTNPTMQRYKELHLLSVVDANTGFQGKSEKCPEEFERCSVFMTTVTLSHLETLNSGELQLGVLAQNKNIAKSVEDESPVGTLYVGDPPVTTDYIITLEGVPMIAGMNAIQRRYFEQITTDILNENHHIQFYATLVLDQTVEGRRKLSSSLRGSLRHKLEALGSTKVVAEIIGAGSESKVGSVVLEKLSDSDMTYMKKLATQQLRPGEINQLDFGEYFSNLAGVQVQPRPAGEDDADAVIAIGTPPETTGNASGSVSIWVIVCIALIMMSIIMICYRSYRDCYASRLPKRRRKDNAKKKRPPFVDTKREEDDETPPLESFDDEILPMIDRPKKTRKKPESTPNLYESDKPSREGNKAIPNSTRSMGRLPERQKRGTRPPQSIIHNDSDIESESDSIDSDPEDVSIGLSSESDDAYKDEYDDESDESESDRGL